MKQKILSTLRNPLVIVPPVVLLLTLGWQQYTYAGRNLSLPRPQLNLLPSGSFDQLTSSGVPAGWQLSKSGTADWQSSLESGYVDEHSLTLTVAGYQSGDITLTSPKLALQANQSYLFKGYYMASVPFELLARYYYKDGGAVLRFVQDYPGNKGVWSTVSQAFNSADTITAVQFVYRLQSNGNLRLDSTYFEPAQQVYIAPPPPAGPNLIPNNELRATDFAMPDSWTPYRAGDNTAAFSYLPDGTIPYFQTSVSDYKNGEAKWTYAPQPVQEHQYYRFDYSYKSDVPAEVVAEYQLADGQRQFQTLDELTPAGDWTAMTSGFETPPGAITLFVSVVLHRDGTLATSEYALTSSTKPGAPHWDQPLVSVSFDDGWESSYQYAIPTLNRYGYKATFYINPSSIETPSFMRATDLEALFAAGNEIAAHGYNHDDMTAINAEELDYQLHEGRDYLQQAGFNITDFATPYGKGDAEVQWYAHKYFTTLRSTETGINTRQNFNPYDLKVLYVDDFTTTQTITDALNQAKQYDGWLILVYHRVGTGKPSFRALRVESTTLDSADFKAQISLINKSGIRVTPVAAAYAELAKQ